jgi:hypothetical protein
MLSTTYFGKPRKRQARPYGAFSALLYDLLTRTSCDLDEDANQHPQMPGKTEESDGKRLVDAAVANKVSHFVFTSVDRGVNSDTDPTNVPHFITKYHIEKHLAAKAKDANMTWTVLRPVAFFDNLINGFIGKAFSSSFLLRMGTDKKLQFIASSDIGWFAAQSFIHSEREEWRNKSVGLAGDELTWTEMKGIFEEKTGETFPLTYEFLASAINWMVKDLGYMFKWMRDVGFGVDVKEVRRMNPEMKDFGTWLETESDWKKA